MTTTTLNDDGSIPWSDPLAFSELEWTKGQIRKMRERRNKLETTLLLQRELQKSVEREQEEREAQEAVSRGPDPFLFGSQSVADSDSPPLAANDADFYNNPLGGGYENERE